MKNALKIFMFIAVLAFAFTSCDNDENLDIILGFSFSPEENIEVGDTVYFSNNSISNMDVVYTWDFGDGVTINEESTKHVYAEPGIYDVKLSVMEGASEKYYTTQINVDADLSYIVNYGSFSGDKSTITAFDKYADEVQNGYYKTVNGVDMVSNVQYAYNFNNNIYLMGNNADGIFWVDNKTFEQTNNAITTDIVKPRYCAGNGNYLYVSCWGGDIWADETVSYIAKVNLTNNTVEKKIALAGGPEGLAVANNKLYAALGYKDSIAVIDLGTEAVSYIETPAVSSYFLKDNNENLYVTFVSTYSDFSTDTGLGYINTSNDQLANYVLPGVNSGYINVMSANSDFSKIYIVTEGANWGEPGGMSVFDVASKSFETNKFLESVPGINGVGFLNGQVFCFVSENATSNGKVVTYSEDGTKLQEYETGIAPFMLLSVE